MGQRVPGKRIYSSGPWGYVIVRVFATNKNVYTFSATGKAEGESAIGALLGFFKIYED